MNERQTMTYDETEAAMCLWEECLGRMNHCRHMGGMSAMEECEMWNWLRCGEGAANARQQCIELAPHIEGSYRIAYNLLGFDDSFDWEFVPRWADHAMELEKYHELTPKWASYLAHKVVRDWKCETCRSFNSEDA